MLYRPRPITCHALKLVSLLALLTVTGGLWLFLPVAPRTSWPSPHGQCRSVLVSGDGRTLLTIHPKAFILWDASTGQPRATLSWDCTGIIGLNFAWLAPDGRKAVLTDQTARGPIFWLWIPDAGPAPIRLNGWWAYPAFTPDSRWVVMTNPSFGNLGLFAARSGERVALPEPMEARLTYFKILGDGRLISLKVPEGDDEPAVMSLWDFHGPVKTVLFPGAKERLVLSPDGSWLASGWKGDDRLAIWDVTSGRRLAVLPPVEPGGTQTALAFSPDNRRFQALLGGEDSVSGQAVWDLDGPLPRLLAETSANFPFIWNDESVLENARFSPDGRWLLTPRLIDYDYFDWQIRDAASMTVRGGIVLGRHSIPVFTPDSGTLAAAQAALPPPSLLDRWLGRPPKQEPSVQLWEVPTGRPIAYLAGCTCFAYSPDGTTLVTAMENGMIQLWDIAPRRPRWVEYGLPVVFILLLLLFAHSCWRLRRAAAAPHTMTP